MLVPDVGLLNCGFPRPSPQAEQQAALHQTTCAQTKPEGNVSGPLCSHPISPDFQTVLTALQGKETLTYAQNM